MTRHATEVATMEATQCDDKPETMHARASNDQLGMPSPFIRTLTTRNRVSRIIPFHYTRMLLKPIPKLPRPRACARDQDTDSTGSSETNDSTLDCGQRDERHRVRKLIGDLDRELCLSKLANKRTSKAKQQRIKGVQKNKKSVKLIPAPVPYN